MKFTKTSTAIFLASAFLISCVGTSYASEGLIELRSTTSENYKCFAASLQMQSQEYKIPTTCRNLIYPIDSTIFHYITWATPLDGGPAVRLGALGLGKVEFRTRIPFSELFVTTERVGGTKTPQGDVVMRGSVEPIDFLQTEFEPTPTPEEIDGQPIPTPEEERKLSTRDRLVLGLKRAGIISLVALVALIGLIFVITRSKG